MQSKTICITEKISHVNENYFDATCHIKRFMRQVIHVHKWRTNQRDRSPKKYKCPDYLHTPRPSKLYIFLQTKTNKGSSLVNQSVIFRKIWFFFFLPTNYKCLPWSSLVWFTTTWHMQKEPAYCWQVCVKVLSTYCFLLFWAIENNLQWVPFTCIEKWKIVFLQNLHFSSAE